MRVVVLLMGVAVAFGTMGVGQLVSAQTVPAEEWVGAPLQPPGGAVTRAEVQAELALAQRSGLLALQAGEGYDPASPQAVAAQARYRQLREGVAFQREVQRIEGRGEERLAGSGRMEIRTEGQPSD